MLESAASALSAIFTLEYAFYMLAGVLAGAVVGVLPGLGGVAGMALLLPFVFGMDPFHGVAMLTGMMAVTHTCDTFPSVLLGVPGSAGSQATILDGYPLARQGRGAFALGASYTASMIGGIFGAIVLLATVTVASPLVQTFGSPQLFMLALLGIATVGVLVKGDVLLGLLSAMLGLMLGMIGIAPATPTYRFDLDQLYLRDGIPLAILALALFAVPEIIMLLTRGESVAKVPSLGAGVLEGVKEPFRHKGLVLRGSVLGTTIGVIPGLGGAVISWMAYALAKTTSRKNNKFGRGDIRGVIGPESANNAVDSGSMIPTLMLAIPGSGSAAVLMGGLLMLGLTPGPEMVSTDLDITLTIVWTLVLANIVAGTLCMVLTRPIAKVTLLRISVLTPFLVVIFLMAAYQATRHIGDIIALVVIGAIALGMRIAGIPRAPMLIGFVLSIILERYLHISISRYGFDWVLFPSVIAIATALFLLIVVAPAVRTLRSRRKPSLKTEGDGGAGEPEVQNHDRRIP